jgi:hypothetical protein
VLCNMKSADDALSEADRRIDEVMNRQ